MKRIIFLLLNCFLFFSVNGKDSGYSIRNYGPKEYGGFNQVWSSVQDSNGIMYFGTSSNIFAYDGKNWTAIPVVSGNAIRSMWIGDDGIIYVGSYGSFGYLEKQKNGSLVYKELSDQLPVSQKRFTDVWKTFTLKGEVIFQTSEGVYFFKDLKYETSVLPANTFALSFLADDHLYIRQRKIGLQEIVNHRLMMVKGGELFADERCLDIIRHPGGGYMLLTGDSGFYSFSPAINDGFHRQHYPCDKYLADCFVLGAKYVDDTTIAINSRIGVGFINLKGNLTGTLTIDDGIIDNSVSGVQVDREKQLWLITGNGISHVFYHNNCTFFHIQKSGYDGDVNSLIDFKGKIYLATTAGLYRTINSTYEKNNSFELLGLAETESWALLSAGDDLFVGTSSGTCIYREGKPLEYLTTVFTRDIIFNKDSTLIFLAEMGGVRELKKENGKWTTSAFQEIPGEHQSSLIAQYRFSGGERIWSIGQSGTLYRVDFTDAGNKLRTYSSGSGIGESCSMFCIVGDSACAKTAKQVYRYHPELDKGDGSFCFIPSAYMDDLIADQKKGLDFTCTEKGKLVRTSNLYHEYPMRRYGFFAKNKRNGLYEAKFLNIPECEPSDFIFSKTDDRGNLWLSYSGMVIKSDSHIPAQPPVSYRTMISQITIGKDSLLISAICGENKNAGPRVDYKNNNLVFHFSAPVFNHEELTCYAYKLEGFDAGWSPFTAAAEKEYTNLPEGDYVFYVKALTILGEEGVPARFSFSILPPWYRTFWAYGIYFVLFVFIIYISIRIASERIIRQKQRLEIVVAERTAEVVLQKQKIETQNSELESAYKGIQDSIHYAERIQHAILPVSTEMENAFPDSFIFFRPRDIVSGDFYWMVKRGNQTWLACVDCTGHGVPGAFMSMIGNTLLNEIVLEKNIESPEKILDLLHVRVRQALRQDAGGETRDGMDISLCLIDRQKNELLFAGANRALWMIRNKELIVLPPDKYSIGGDQGDKERRFTLQRTDLVKGDCIYLSSDGYADQFGGPKGKKFMVKRFQQLLLDIHKLPMKQQGEAVEKAFDEWKNRPEAEGNKKYDQVDDVLVIGFCIN
jgi:serine phosphatase RsbU (regulator of sigma subunit)